jgi:hypothetical protein
MKLLERLSRRRKPAELLPGTFIANWHGCKCPARNTLAHDCPLHGIAGSEAV